MQNRSISGITALAPLAAEASSAGTSTSFNTFLAAIESWLDYARENEVIALAALVNTECDRRSQEVQATDRQRCGQAA